MFLNPSFKMTTSFANIANFLCKLKQKNFLNENGYDKLYPSGSAPARIYGTPKMYKFSSSDSFPKLRPIVSSIGTFNYNLARFLYDLLSPLVPNDDDDDDDDDEMMMMVMIFPKNFLFLKMYLVFLLIFHFKKPLILQ